MIVVAAQLDFENQAVRDAAVAASALVSIVESRSVPAIPSTIVWCTLVTIA